MDKQVIDLDDFPGINVPETVAKCPYCDAPLYICEIDEYSEGEDGALVPEHFSLDCTEEPDMADPGWEEFINWHIQMPYVYWLPLEEPVKQWLIKTYEFACLGKSGRSSQSGSKV